MIVVLDTNIWLSELGLNSALGAATRFFLKQKNAIVALPEVVRLETQRNFCMKLGGFVKEIEASFRQLLAIFGRLKEVVLPDDTAIASKVSELFAQTGVELLEVKFSLESARDSFLKTIEKTPPSDRSQEFKDGVLWTDCLNLLKSDDVYLVTSDKAFYKDREYAKGLADNLRREASTANHKFCILSLSRTYSKTSKLR